MPKLSAKQRARLKASKFTDADIREIVAGLSDPDDDDDDEPTSRRSNGDGGSHRVAILEGTAAERFLDRWMGSGSDTDGDEKPPKPRGRRAPEPDPDEDEEDAEPPKRRGWFDDA